MKGSKVRVSKGRKVPVGTVGVVIWMGEGKYGTRVGVKDEVGEVHWTAASNCTVLEAAAPAAPFVAPVGLGKGVTVTSPVGTGKVFWVGEDKRNPGKARIGVKLASGMSGFFSAEECGFGGERDREAEEVAEERAREAAAEVAEVAPERAETAAPAAYVPAAMAWAGKAA